LKNNNPYGMKVPESFFVVSNWNNDVSWVEKYTDNYIIYDKSNTLPANDRTIKLKNVGYNVYDMAHFIVNNYDNLPELTAFLQGNPFDHCKKETFDRLIYNTCFTPLEDYTDVPESNAHIKDVDGGYMEINNSWYFRTHRQEHGAEVEKYVTSYNRFLDEIFESPEHLKWIRFAPGAQYIVPKENILFYSKEFYRKLMRYVDYHRIPSEGFALERAMYYIFTNRWRERMNDEKKELNELDILARKYGTDKRTNDTLPSIYHGYTDTYYNYLFPGKLGIKNLLEIGVSKGSSHYMWADFLPNAMIYGIDNFLDPSCTVSKEELESNPRIKIIVGDQSDKLVLNKFKEIPLDVIIDDGSHFSWDQQRSFDVLWDFLLPGGYYFFEDLGESFNNDFREFEDMRSATVRWLHTMKKGKVPFSYYTRESKMERIFKEILSVKAFGELVVIQKKII